MSKGIRAVAILGLVSLLGDLVYEGGRSVLPDYMRQLGMDAFMVGAALGVGELAGWAARPLGGMLADKTGRYSLVVKLGYAGLFVIPLMGFAPFWWLLVVLAFLERVFRGMRVPARDAMLVRLRGDVKIGKAFGLHELMDQVGAAGGPLLAIFVLISLPIPFVYYILAIPYLILLIVLTRVPTYREKAAELKGLKPTRGVVLISLAAALNTAGLLPVPLLLYMVSLQAGSGSWLIPAAYTIAMVVDAFAGLILGILYDRWGIKIVALVAPVSILPTVFIYSDVALLMVAAFLIGVVIGAQESIFRAAVADLARLNSLGSVYASYGLAFGAGAAIAGAVYGYMIQTNTGLEYILLFTALMQTISAILILNAAKQKK
ncbi:MAG: MFS transporter [Candidatus Caldarchaeum sp.]